jgi:hypothetical protein
VVGVEAGDRDRLLVVDLVRALRVVDDLDVGARLDGAGERVDDRLVMELVDRGAQPEALVRGRGR